MLTHTTTIPHRGYAVRVQGQPYELGPYVPPLTHYALLSEILRLHRPYGVALEFGVGSGQSTRIIAEHMPVIGFDSFEGLPEDWRDGFPAGSFAQEAPPEIDGAHYQVGLFDVTIPRFNTKGLRDVGLMHIDCDLYSSTATVLAYLGHLLLRHNQVNAHPIVVFDEWHGYDGAEKYEQRAWREWVDASRGNIKWSVLGHSHQAWAVQL